MSDSIPNEIHPLDELLEDVERSYDDWYDVDDSILDFDDIVTPWQSTIRGTQFQPSAVVPGSSDSEANEILASYYDLRMRAEREINCMQNTFFNDAGAVSARLSYGPVRLLGWWVKNMSDEIDWILANGGDLEDPYHADLQRFEFKTAPPAFSSHDLTPEGVHNICVMAAVLQGRPSSDVQYLEDKIWGNYDREKTLAGRPLTMDDEDILLAGSIRHTITSHRTVGNVVGIDLETTGLKATRAWIIDAGWLRMDLHDREEHEINPTRRSYGVSKTRRIIGNPVETINHVSMDSIADLKPIELDADAQGEILETLSSGVPFVAHSAGIEDAFFRQNVDGYAEAKRDGLVKIIDSRRISQWLDDYDGKQGNHLEQYARRWNALDPETGKERHLGLDDAEIMLKAMGRHLRAITPQDL
jgi:DNA polymerase III epsilon subunit-like protein